MGAATRSIRRHLFQIVLVGILPVGLLAAALLFTLWHVQTAQREESQMETTRLLAAAVDNALDSSIQRLSILARILATRPADGATLYEHARTALAASPDWENMLAFAADGNGLFRLDKPWGTSVPAMMLRDYSATALREKRPAVSDIFTNVYGESVVGVAVPVVRDDAVTHVLIASLNLDWFDQLLHKQGLPPGGIGGIFDTRLKFVARSAEGDSRRGNDPAPQLYEKMRVAKTGLDHFQALDGSRVYTSWTPTRHGWTVAFATPAGPVEGALWSHILLFGGLWALLMGAGLAFAAHQGRRISSALKRVEAASADIARGAPGKPLPASGLAEFDQAQAGLERAGALLADVMRKLDRSLATEREARAAAEAASEQKDQFLAMLGHELRNPLAAVSNATAVLHVDSAGPEQKRLALDVLARQCAQLKRLIDDLLDVGRVMTGKVRLERAPVDLAASVRQTVETLQAAGALQTHRVRMLLEPAWVDGDAARLEQVIANLVGNAAAHTAPGGEVRVELCVDGPDRAIVRVADTGDGIAPEDLPRVFDLFFQGQAAGQRPGGLGIGLTLVKRLVELHGGKVLAESPGRGKGAVFTVHLPAIAAPRPAHEPPSPATAGLTVLVVEDQADERETLRIALELHGHRVLAAGDAQAALDCLAVERPAVAVLDIGLPGKDGHELAREIRARLGPAIRLIALTGYGMAADAERAMEAGFELHLAKPVDLRELSRAISQAPVFKSPVAV